jgi:lactoylglutathione lyase
MLPIKGLYEVAIPVRSLDTAERFYRDVLGFEEGLRDEPRRWLFLRAPGNAAMIVLQEKPGAWHQLHFAFTIDEADVDRATASLRARGVAIDGPHVHDWMPAVSVYFTDPDGHDLELCAPLRRK